MFRRMLTQCNDEITSSCVNAGDYIFLAHFDGDQD